MTYNFADIGILIFRVVVGLSMAFGHGLGKLTKLLNGGEIKFMNFWGLGAEFSLFLAVMAEFVFAILVTLGLFTRLSSIPIIITMAVAAFIVHAGDPFSSKEKAILFLASFLMLFFVGPGKYSVQYFIKIKFDKLKGFLKFILS